VNVDAGLDFIALIAERFFEIDVRAKVGLPNGVFERVERALRRLIGDGLVRVDGKMRGLFDELERRVIRIGPASCGSSS